MEELSPPPTELVSVGEGIGVNDAAESRGADGGKEGEGETGRTDEGGADSEGDLGANELPDADTFPSDSLSTQEQPFLGGDASSP